MIISDVILHISKKRIIKEVVERYLDCGNPMCCPSCGGQMRIISFIEEPKIIALLKLTFEAERPPPPHIAHQELLMAAEERGEYF